MNTRTLLSLLALSTINSQLSTSASAQGSLTPPAGPPVASMKTLDQVEARTPLVAGAPGVTISAAGTITISQPGSYYLTKNVTITTNVSGLVINAEATVDLNGFSIIGTAAAITTAPAVSLGDFEIVLRNGMIKGGTVVGTTDTPSATGGFFHGIQAPVRSTKMVCLSDLTVTGVRHTGILMERNCLVERCRVQSVGGSGIQLTVSFSQPTLFIHATVRDCHVSGCAGTNGGEAVGIWANTVSHSVAHILASGSNTSASKITGIRADMVEYSRGWATGSFIPGGTAIPEGISGRIVSFSLGRGGEGGGQAIGAFQSIGCFSEGGTIAGGKQLGTP